MESTGNEHILSLRGEVLTHMTSLIPPFFIEVIVLSNESERSCIVC